MTPPLSELRDWLHHRATTTPDRIALLADGERWTFAELDEEATRLARRLGTLRVGAGDRVATILHNGATAATLPHAVIRLGAALVPLNVRAGAAEIAWLVEHCRPRIVIVEERTASLLEIARREQPGLVVVSIDTLTADAAHAGLVALDAIPEVSMKARLQHDAGHVAVIVYTSGTTGRPRGVMLTIANLWWSAIGSALNLGAEPNDRWLLCLPLFHVGGLSILFRAAIYGIAAVVHDGFDAVEVNRAIDEERITIVSVVSVMLQRMLDARGERPYPDTLRCVLLGGGPAPLPLLERCSSLGVPVVQTYGLTETASQLATLAPEDALRKLGSAGHPLYPNEIRILFPDGRLAPAETEGEIVVRGPVVMAGYLNQPDATARAISNGWLHTGDIGRVDRDGYLYVLDRRDDLIISGGENVYPAEVEAALLGHPLVVEAGVVGAPDSEWGHRVVAIVRLLPDASADGATEALRAHCRTLLGGYKVPREVHIVTDPLPRTASGKLQRAHLRRQFARNA